MQIITFFPVVCVIDKNLVGIIYKFGLHDIKTIDYIHFMGKIKRVNFSNYIVGNF